MEVYDNIFETYRVNQSIKKTLCPRRGLNRQEAAIYIGCLHLCSTSLLNRERCQNHYVSNEELYGTAINWMSVSKRFLRQRSIRGTMYDR